MGFGTAGRKAARRVKRAAMPSKKMTPMPKGKSKKMPPKSKPI